MFMFTLYLYFLCIMSWGGRVSHLLCSPQSRCQHYLYLCERCPLPAPKRKSLTKVSPNLQYISTRTLSKYVSKKMLIHMILKNVSTAVLQFEGDTGRKSPKKFTNLSKTKLFHFVILKKKWIFAANCVTSTEEESQYCSAQHQHRYILQFCQFPFSALICSIGAIIEDNQECTESRSIHIRIWEFTFASSIQNTK